MSQLSRENLLEGFIGEVSEYVPQIRNDLAHLREYPADRPRLQQAFRLFHNIKGAAAQLDLAYLSGSARLAEDYLESLLADGSPLKPTELDFLNDTADDILSACVTDVRSDETGVQLLRKVLRHYYRATAADKMPDDMIVRQDFDSLYAGKSILVKSPAEEMRQHLQRAVGAVAAIRESSGRRDDSGLQMGFNDLKEAVSMAGARAMALEDGQPASFIDLLSSYIDWLESEKPNLDIKAATLLEDYLGFLDLLVENPGKIEGATIKRIAESMTQVRELSTLLVGSPDEALDDFSELLDDPDFLSFDDTDDEFAGEGRTTEDFFSESGLSDDAALFEGSPVAEEEPDETGDVSVPEPGVKAAEAVQDKPGFEEEDEDDLDLHDIFMAECEEHLQVIGTALINLEQLVEEPSPVSGPVLQHLSDMRRAVHTLKGAAGMTGFDKLSGFAHNCEDLLDFFFESDRVIEGQDIALLARAVDLIETMALQPEQSGDSDTSGITTAIAERLKQEGPQGDQSEKPVDETAKATEAVQGRAGFVEEDEDDLDLHDIFMAECEEHLQVIGKALINLEQLVEAPTPVSGPVLQHLSDMRRAVHTLKGAAGMTGFDKLSGFAHACEDLLDFFFEPDRVVAGQDIALLARAIDLIESMALQPQQSGDSDTSGIMTAIAERLKQEGLQDGQPEETVDELAVLFDGEEEPTEEVAEQSVEAAADSPEEVPGKPAVDRRKNRDADDARGIDAATIRVRLERLDELVSLESELIVARSAMDQRLSEMLGGVRELNLAKEKLRKISQELESGFEVESLYGFGQGGAAATGGSEAAATEFTDFDPIELDRYSRLNLIIRSLNELAVDVGSIHTGIAGLANDMRGHIANQQLLMRVMQDRLMQVRMTPLSSLTRSFFRAVRGAAEALGKRVRLTVEGEDVYLDRYVWNRVTDPIMHILRNAVDHGTESAEKRKKSGKAEQGHIRMKAAQRGNHVLLDITDDGSGIDVETIRRALRRRGLAEQADRFSDEELYEQLFAPGFSTREEVSRISGRGVGLDVVRENMRELKGSVRVTSQPGQGTTFRLRIPVTLSINRAAIVILGGKKFAVPLQDIIEIRKVPMSDLINGKQLQVRIADENLVLKDLGRLFRLRDALPQMASGQGDITVIVVEGERSNVAMIIDHVIEQQEIIIKDLGTHLKHVEGISGATIMGDGSLLPILNVGELAQIEKTSVDPAKTKPKASAAGPFKVMIVDDSVSVRQSVSRLIKNQGWTPLMATDGVDATEKIDGFMPEAIILDIEMPRMNGFEFLGVLRSNNRFKSIPVIMLTSRYSDKHQRKAEELGADHYVIKPYKEDQFVALLRKIAKEDRG